MSISQNLLSTEQLVEKCKMDGELKIASRFWAGGLTFAFGSHHINLVIDNGEFSAGTTSPDDTICYSADTGIWEKLLAAKPDRHHADLNVLLAEGKASFEGDLIKAAQYQPAILRIIELLREPGDISDPILDESGDLPRFDSPVGRYVHLEVLGEDYRIYFEEAGQGIPLLLQHTAGAHGTQFRHLFECREITDYFRLIAYDLPYHGKSIPPVNKKWWTEEYKLRGDFVRELPVKLVEALELKDPMFMGCSVGGMLALDLAYHSPDVFSHCISLEGALSAGGPDDMESYWLVYHPGISNQYKARNMNGIMSPTSPERYRQETMQTYAAGWPAAFYGDLQYYLCDYDLQEKAQDIDTSKCGVTILCGEYDYSGSIEKGRAAHELISGSDFVEMKGIGHFPMSENPAVFLEYLIPVLKKIRNKQGF
jgi:pimeloyl-ACP methyl ester carboxylesterase